MDWLEVVVGEVGSHITHTDLGEEIGYYRIQYIYCYQHTCSSTVALGSSHQIGAADGEQLGGLLVLGLGLRHQQGDGEQDISKGGDSLSELA